jgi:hypothetical protein
VDDHVQIAADDQTDPRRIEADEDMDEHGPRSYAKPPAGTGSRAFAAGPRGVGDCLQSVDAGPRSVVDSFASDEDRPAPLQD